MSALGSLFSIGIFCLMPGPHTERREGLVDFDTLKKIFKNGTIYQSDFREASVVSAS